MSQTVTIDSKAYTIYGRLESSMLPQWTPAIRTTGELTREDRTPVPQWAPEDITGGLGREFYDPSKNQFHFATADTRFPGQITLPLLKQTATLTTIGATALIGNKAEYLSKLRCLWWIPGTETVLHNCDTAWTATAGSTASADTTDYVVGTASAKCAVTGAVVAGVIVQYTSIGDNNLQNDRILISFWFRSSVALDAADYMFAIDDTNACASPLVSLPLPAIVANTWTRVTLKVGTTAAAAWDGVLYVGFEMNVDKEAHNIWVDDLTTMLDGATATGEWNDSTDKWEDVTDVAPVSGIEGYCRDGGDMVAHEGKLCVLSHWGGVLFTSDNGTTWTEGATIPSNFQWGTKLLSFGEELWAVGWDGDRNIIVAKTSDWGATWTECSSITSSGEATGFCTYYDEAGDPYPFVGTREGAYLIETTLLQPFLYVDLRQLSSTYTCATLLNWNGYLMCPAQNGLIRHYYASGTNTYIGLDKDDGLPATYSGPITAMCTILDKLYVATKGTNAAIFCLTTDGQGWHTIWGDSSSGGTITNLWASGITTVPTLFFSTAVNKHYFIEYIHANPLQLAAKYETSAYIDYPVFGGHLPETQSGFYKISAHASNLSATEKLTVSYGLDEAVPTTVALGDITSTVRSLKLGSNLGVEGRVIQMRFTLARSATNTLTPVLHYPVLDYRTMPYFSHIYYCQIDLDATATAQSVSAATVITNLKALSEKRTLTAFVGGGNTENVLVDVLDIGYFTDSHTPPAAQYYATVQMTEVQ